MMMTLIRREILDNLMTFRFAAAVFIMLLLVVANTAVLIQDYERRLAGHNAAVKMHQRQLQEKKTYSAGMDKLLVDRPPNPLSILNAGFDKRLGNKVWHHTDMSLPSGTQACTDRTIRLWICSPQWILSLSLRLSLAY